VGTTRFVYVSSGGVVYGEPEVRPTPEGTIKQPLSPYGVSKLSGEYYLNYYNRIRGLQYVALRYSNVYGPRQDPHGEAGVVAIFCERLLDGRALTVFGDGEQTRDYVFVGDVVRANLAATDVSLEGLPGDGIDRVAFNVGTGIETSVNGLADVLEGIAGSAQGREYREARPGELRNSSLDNGRLSRLGWKPATSLRDGLLQTYEHIARTRGQR
jgi:UDP-glucose 4-epimerase